MQSKADGISLNYKTSDSVLRILIANLNKMQFYTLEAFFGVSVGVERTSLGFFFVGLFFFFPSAVNISE